MDRPVLATGLSASLHCVVGVDDTAERIGSGSLPVLATPRVLAWFEAASCAAVSSSLAEGTSSVGTRITVEHLRPSRVGAGVVVTATLAHVDGRLLRFDATATDDGGLLLATGEVTRVVVENARFLSRAAGQS